jgi:hypothetical protein
MAVRWEIDMALITINRPVVVLSGLESVPRRNRRSWRRGGAATLALVVGLALGAMGTGALASPSGGSTTNVSFVSLTPAFKLLANRSFAANAQYSPVVIGGSTKVPTNATTVQIVVTASSKSGGDMGFWPTGNVNGRSGQILSWGPGHTATMTIQENVGVANELTFANGNGATTASATITGYSTQVTAADVSPVDGTAGQVLTNTGAGAEWRQLPSTFANVKVVAETNGPTDAGSRLVNAINSIGGSTPTTILLEPGTYDIGAATITLPANLTISGTSDTNTTIQSEGTGSVITAAADDSINGVRVVGAPAASVDTVLLVVPDQAALTVANSSLSSTAALTDTGFLGTVSVLGSGTLDVQHSRLGSATEGGGGVNYTIGSAGTPTVSITGSTISASGEAKGTTVAIAANNTTLNIEDSTLTGTVTGGNSGFVNSVGAITGFDDRVTVADSALTTSGTGGAGVQSIVIDLTDLANDSSLSMRGSVLTATDRANGDSRALNLDTVPATIDSSKLIGAWNAIYTSGSAKVAVGGSMLAGPVFGTVTCAASYDGNYAALPTTC